MRTPGPWEQLECDHQVVRAHNQAWVAHLYPHPEADDNARLIAAAGTAATEAEKLGFDGLAAIQALPGLLEALDEAAKSWEMLAGGYFLSNSSLQLVRTAIAKAKGQS